VNGVPSAGGAASIVYLVAPNFPGMAVGRAMDNVAWLHRLATWTLLERAPLPGLFP
jgi:hypothetical protein